ncbi:alpha-mannosidase 2 isoform X1 [Vigna unguiculata]|uniref:Alpha-mannosidase n=1 Tax=Vigna unguiculata TaxID=3917 RepID=A0A4D6M357_VIGUN|nr:alpha-mannosidase 2 isoform X1 [Vigna unguiculata]QCD94971.1 alpha-mannosidase II [Vigna unguiculata]
MPFSSRRGTPWASSILPSSNPKSKVLRKGRRRGWLTDFIFSNFFTIGLVISLSLFLLILLRFGVPKPIATHFRTRSSRARKSFGRRPLPNVLNTSALAGAGPVDITTKELYDKIEFLDVDGGAWKQGWSVTYRGNEWDAEKLKVFVVPHSHNDPGWKLTVEEYYDRQSRHILDTIVQTLTKDSRRKFIWEEMSYLERWWRDAPDEMKESFINLVKNGQLEIVGGGWVMNDEANSHYFSIIEQVTEGNMWLNDTIGFVPKNSWAIDPFGYSSTMAYLLRRMGFDNMLIQRTHYEVKKELAWHKKLEYIWRQSWDTDETTDIFVHMMPFYSYDIPHTCGPEPAVCCQFDFARMQGFVYEQCPWGQYPVETTQENVQERALKLLDQYRKKSTLYRTNTLLVPLGDDFRYINVEEAEAQFRNYQMLFDYINSNPSLNTEAKFGTLEDYFVTLREEAERINYSLPGEIGSGLVEGFPSLSGDFFTYSDRQQDYWSGYYVSRPFFKAVDRVLEQTLRATEMMVALILGCCRRSHCEKFAMGFSYKLTAARRNLALFQHHDGVTGTAKDHVVMDYGMRMHTSLLDLQIFMSKAVEALLGIRYDKLDHSPSQFEPAIIRSKYDAQPLHKVIGVHDNSYQSVVFFNPLEQTSEEVVMLVVDSPDVTVVDSNWSCVQSQILPELQHHNSKIFTGKHRLYWEVSVPALGLETYYISNGFDECEKAKPAKLKIFSKSNSIACPKPYSCVKIEADEVEIENQNHKLTFDVKYGLLQKIISKNNSPNTVKEEIGLYSSSGGAYLFKPNGDAQPIIEEGGQLLVSEGPLMQEVYSYPRTTWEKAPISHSTRIYSGESTVQGFVIEKEYHVELLGHEFNDKELIVRYKTDIDNKKVFYSDLNGFQMSRRETYDKIPLQGNYYPLPSLAFIQGSNGRRFSVHSRQSLGVASLKNGWLEIMLDRRLVRDDGRGLGQGVMDNRVMNVVFHLTLETNVSATPNLASTPFPYSPSLLSNCVGSHLNYPLHTFISKKPQDKSEKPPPRSFSPLAAPLPCDLHIVNFKVPKPLKFLQQPLEGPRFVLILHRRHWDSSYCRKGRTQCTNLGDVAVNLFSMFQDVTVSKAKATSLNLLHEDPEVMGFSEQFGDVAQEGHVAISAMEIQAYKLELRPQQ